MATIVRVGIGVSVAVSATVMYVLACSYFSPAAALSSSVRMATVACLVAMFAGLILVRAPVKLGRLAAVAAVVTAILMLLFAWLGLSSGFAPTPLFAWLALAPLSVVLFGAVMIVRLVVKLD
jgi:hypothetical protein